MATIEELIPYATGDTVEELTDEKGDDDDEQQQLS